MQPQHPRPLTSAPAAALIAEWPSLTADDKIARWETLLQGLHKPLQDHLHAKAYQHGTTEYEELPLKKKQSLPLLLSL